MLLAFASQPEELEVLMLSLQFGNVEVQNCLRNVVTLFSFIEKERAWRKEHGRPAGFEALDRTKPIVAVGAEEPLAEHMMAADYFHGIDGLGGIHESHPHLSPAETWKTLFSPAPENMPAEDVAALRKVEEEHKLFAPSKKPAHEEMLRLLRENERDTITIVAVGPLTNVATAAATDPETFLRVKEVIVMGGAIDEPGNITPGGEFNFFADSVAAARVLALTSPNPKTTMPPSLHLKSGPHKSLPDYPDKLSRPLKVRLFPVDVTMHHKLPERLYHDYVDLLADSPLANWSKLFLKATFEKVFSLAPKQDRSKLGLEMHDPLTIWYAITGPKESPAHAQGWEFIEQDIRVETAGQWTRGMCVVDRRPRVVRDDVEGDVMDEIVGDADGWCDSRRGNRIIRCVGSPGAEKFAPWFMERVFGKVE